MKKLLIAVSALGAAALFGPSAGAAPLLGSMSVLKQAQAENGEGAIQQVRHRYHRRGYGTYYHPPRDSKYWERQRSYNRGHLHRGYGPSHPHW